MRFPSKTILFLATTTSIFASALALVSILWQHIASVAFTTSLQNLTYGGVQGRLGVLDLVLGWTAVASIMLVSAGLVLLYQSIAMLDRLVVGED